jgi:chaperonin GroES
MKTSKKKTVKKIIHKSKNISIVSKTPDFKVRPLGDRVLIKEDNESKEQTTASGIIIPVSAQEDKGSKRGRVVAIGNGKMEDGKMTPLTVKVGDKVLFQWGDKIQVDSEEYYIVRESEILAIIK